MYDTGIRLGTLLNRIKSPLINSIHLWSLAFDKCVKTAQWERMRLLKWHRDTVYPHVRDTEIEPLPHST